MLRAAIDADIFFFSISQKSENLTKRDINPYDIKKLLFHLSGHSDISLCVPISVLNETDVIAPRPVSLAIQDVLVVGPTAGESLVARACWHMRSGQAEIHWSLQLQQDTEELHYCLFRTLRAFAQDAGSREGAKPRSFDERRTIMF